MDVNLARAAELLAGAAEVVVSTGAGMSRESGIPTFRDALEGFWARYDPAALATEAGFRADPRLVWSWYVERRKQIEACRPHAGYAALVELAGLIPRLEIVTQNIDGLHALAGSAAVTELHGNLRRARCLDRGHPFRGPLPPPEEGNPPPCPECGSPLRPDVVWFGEILPPDATERAWELAARCDVMLVVGTSGTVWPAAELPRVARAGGAPIVEVNPEPSELTPIADVFLRAAAGDVLPELTRAVRAARRA